MSDEEGSDLVQFTFEHHLNTLPRNTSTLIDRLKALEVALYEGHKVAFDPKSLYEIARILVSPKLIQHKDVGVKAHTAYCICDILRLCAPDAPYNLAELQKIFSLFIDQIALIDSPNDIYYKEHYYILEQIAYTESIALIVDFQNVEPLTIKIFRLFYKIAETFGKTNLELEFTLTKILSTLTAELETLPSEAVDIVISRFFSPPPKSTLEGNQSLPLQSIGYQMSKAICTDHVDIMTRHANQYFADILTNLSTFDDDYTESHKDDKKDSKRDSLKKQAQERLLTLAEQIWIAVPDLLSSIMGQLEQGLSTEDPVFRELTTKTIGNIIGYSPSRIAFVKNHFSTWKAWLGRSLDKLPTIRIAWINATPSIITSRIDVAAEVAKVLSDKLTDPDEKVRIAACNAVGNLSVETIAAKLDKSFSFEELFSRLRDKKPSVRTVAFDVIGNLFKEAYHYIEEGNTTYLRIFGPIPQKIFEQAYLNDREVIGMIDITLNTCICTQDTDDTKRTTRLLTILNNMEETGRNAFNATIKRQFQLSKALVTVFAIKKEAGNKPLSEAQLKKIESCIKWMSTTFNDSLGAENLIVSLFEQTDKSVGKNLQTCINPEADYKTVFKAVNDLLSKFKAHHRLLSIFLYRVSFLILNRSTINPVIEISKNSSSNLSSIAHELLKTISASQPALMKSHVSDLISIIERTEVGTKGSTDTLKATNLLADRFADMLPQTSTFFNSLVDFATTGSPEEATEAIKLITYSEKKELYYNKVIDVVTELDLKNNLLATYLSAITELYRTIPLLIEPKSDQIFPFLTKVISTNQLVAKDDDPLWVEDKDLNTECQAKVLALKIYVKRLMYALSDMSTIESFSKLVFTLLASTIVNIGELVRVEHSATPEFYKSRMRLEAGIQFLELATGPDIRKLIKTKEVTKLAFLVQDSVLEVRKRFLHSLMNYWSTRSISNRFLPLIFMAAFERNRDLNHYVSTWIRSRAEVNERRALADPKNNDPELIAFELCLPSLIHMVVHYHGNLEESGDETLDSLAATAIAASENTEKKTSETHKVLPPILRRISIYLLFYLTNVATESNISLIYYVSQRVKNFQDNVDESKSSQLYLVSDMAQLIIKKFQEFRGWQLSSWPGSIRLPSDIFKQAPWETVGKKVSQTSYLLPIYTKSLEDFVRKKLFKLRKQNGEYFGGPEADALLDDDVEENEGAAEAGEKTNGTKSRKRSGAGEPSASKRRKTSGATRQTKLTMYGKKRKARNGRIDDDDDEDIEETKARRSSAANKPRNKLFEPKRRSNRLAAASVKDTSLKEASSSDDFEDYLSEEEELESDEEQEEEETKEEKEEEKEDEQEEDEDEEEEEEKEEIPKPNLQPKPKPKQQKQPKQLAQSKQPRQTRLRRQLRKKEEEEDHESEELEEEPEEALSKKTRNGRTAPKRASTTSTTTTTTTTASSSKKTKAVAKPTNTRAKRKSIPKKKEEKVVEEKENILIDDDDEIGSLSELSYDSDLAAEADFLL
ncbi:uncharacterized protein SAPINGB_P000490 [Magnusiomyces paraingens]|uniref:Uncharacterized protein n=1 Tax=Magnusiomyces paraingens TaxID=2606893 RepID=A0A5E8B1J8_9ASCO|nr:uncharacterized protein SAPINGB_P000490 [Saprochaete ingens]VVT44660.1 unnamed protein product [Saprochaete ingens]